MGRSKDLGRGQWCICIGHPGGYQPGRSAPVRVGRILDNRPSGIRTDCVLVGGDSGGPLFDTKGMIIGINSRIGSTIRANLHAPIDAFTRALKSKPTETDLLLNLANAHRLANHPVEVIKYAKEALAIDANLDAGHFLIGCAHLRLDQATEATKALQQAYYIDNTVGAVGYLLGKAQLAAGNAEEAAMLFEEVAAFETDHLGAAYALSQALTALGRTDEAKAALELHQQRIAGKKMPDQPGHWEMCSHTEVRIPSGVQRRINSV